MCNFSFVKSEHNEGDSWDFCASNQPSIGRNFRKSMCASTAYEPKTPLVQAPELTQHSSHKLSANARQLPPAPRLWDLKWLTCGAAREFSGGARESFSMQHLRIKQVPANRKGWILDQHSAQAVSTAMMFYFSLPRDAKHITKSNFLGRSQRRCLVQSQFSNKILCPCRLACAPSMGFPAAKLRKPGRKMPEIEDKMRMPQFSIHLTTNCR